MKTAKKIVIVVIVCLLAMEVMLRISGVFKTSSEKQGKGYISNYGEIKPTWYKNHKAYDSFVPPSADFKYPYLTNKFGLREKDHSTYRPDSVYRILITGNSYVEGSGAPYDSTWPRLLEDALRSRKINAEVIDAGLAGNDILFDYVYYRDKLNDYYHPDLVIGTMNSSDYVYYTFRGGMERFYPDSTTHYLPIPWYDNLFRYSHLFRAILAISQFPIEGTMVSRSNYEHTVEQATEVFGTEINNYRNEATKNNARFVCIFYPKIQDMRYDWFLKISIQNFNRLSQILQKDSIEHFSLFNSFTAKFSGIPEKEYSYPNNGHYRPAGYLVMAGLTADSLIASGVIDSTAFKK